MSQTYHISKSTPVDSSSLRYQINDHPAIAPTVEGITWSAEDNMIDITMSAGLSFIELENLTQLILEHIPGMYFSSGDQRFRADQYRNGYLVKTTWYKQKTNNTLEIKVREMTYTYQGNRLLSSREELFDTVGYVVKRYVVNYEMDVSGNTTSVITEEVGV